MSDKFEYCSNCKRDIAAANYVIHSVHCERRIQLCNFCSEPVPITEMEQHLENTHTMDACASCNMQMEKWRLEKHKDVCVKRTVSCKFCDLELGFDLLDEHIAVCGTRTEKCPICNEYVMKKDKDVHPIDCEKNVYSKSFLPCEFCELAFPIDYISIHAKLCGTQSKKCSICKEHVMLKDKEKHSEFCSRNTHFNIPVPCEYCEEKVPSYQLYEHSAVCGSRVQKCLKCGTDVMLKDIEKHSYMCIPVSKTFGECRICHEKVAWVDMNVHESYCHSYGSSDGVCKVSDTMPVNKTEDKQIIQKFKQCPYCEKRLPDLIMANHLKACIERPYNCERCLKPMPYKNKMTHMESQCKSVHQTPARFSGPEETYAAAAPVRTRITERGSLEKNYQTCPHCNFKITEISFERHVKICSKSKKRCQFCGMDIFIEQEKSHLQSCIVVANDFDKEPAFEIHSNKKKNRKKNKNDKPDKPTDEKSWFPWLSKKTHSSPDKEYIPQLPEVALLPCEFCEHLFPESLIIEHQSGCRPDLVSFPPDLVGFPQTETGRPSKNQVVDDSKIIHTSMKSCDHYEFATAADPAEAIRSTGALPKTKNSFYTMNSNTRPEEFRDNNNVLPKQTGFGRNYSCNPSSVGGNTSITEYSQSEESKKLLKSQHKKTLDAFMTDDHKIDAESANKISAKSTPKMLFKFTTDPGEHLENNNVSYQSDNPLPRATGKSFQTKEFNTGSFQDVSTYRNSSTDNKKPLANDLKAVGAERAEKKGIFQISRDTEMSSIASAETLENYETYCQVSQNSPDSDNKQEKEMNSSKLGYSGTKFNISVREEVADLNELEKVVTSQSMKSTSVSLSEQQHKCSDFNENTLVPFEPFYMEDDVKNEETFGNDYMALTEQNFNENNLSDSEDNFYDAEESLKISNNSPEDGTSSSLNKDSNLDAYFSFLRKDKDELVESNNVQNGESLKRLYESKQNCDCNNEICYCAIINQLPSSENNRSFFNEAGALTGTSSFSTSSDQFGKNCTQPMNETSCAQIIDPSFQQNTSNMNIKNIAEEKKGPMWSKWRSKKSYDTDSD